jgi:hypothetical protein
VRVVVVVREEVRIVGCQHRQVQLLGELENASIEIGLILGVVRLDLEVVAITEDVGVPGRSGSRLVVFIGQQVVRDLASHAGR